MVFTFIADLVLQTGLWTAQKTYNFGYYMIYGKEETVEDKLRKIIEEMETKNKLDREKDIEHFNTLKKLLDEHNKYLEQFEKFNNRISQNISISTNQNINNVDDIDDVKLSNNTNIDDIDEDKSAISYKSENIDNKSSYIHPSIYFVDNRKTKSL